MHFVAAHAVITLKALVSVYCVFALFSLLVWLPFGFTLLQLLNFSFFSLFGVFVFMLSWPRLLCATALLVLAVVLGGFLLTQSQALGSIVAC